MRRYTWQGYREAGMPYGKNGYPEWLQKQYEAEIEALKLKNARLSVELAKAQYSRVEAVGQIVGER
jgi:hypothetical protein